MFRKQWWTLLLLTTLLLLVPDVASATTMHALTNVQTGLKGIITAWDAPLQKAALNLFYVFAAIEIAILAMNHGLRQRGHDELFNSLIRKVVVLGFFMTCIDNGPVWANAIINGLSGGVSALGLTAVTPSTIAGFAENAFFTILFAPIHAANLKAGDFLTDFLTGDWTGALNQAVSLMASDNTIAMAGQMIMSFVIACMTAIAIFMLALELLMVTLESYLVIAFGVVVLAGGGLRYTAKYVNSYFDYAVNVGFRLLIITAIAYLVADPSNPHSLMSLMTTIMTNVVNPFQMGVEVLALGAIMALLPKKASSIASSILSGSSSFSGGELGKGMMAIGAGTAAIAAAPVALAAAGAAGGAAAGSMGASMGGGAASGGGGALMGATQAAQAGGAAAQGGAGSMGAGMGSAGGGAGSMEGASMKSVPTPDAKGMEQMRASVQKPSASGSSTNSKSNDAPPPAEKTGKISEGSAGSSPSAGPEGGSNGSGESLVAEAGEAAGVAGLTAEAVAHGTAAKGASAAQGTSAAPASGPAASTAGPSPVAGSSPSAGGGGNVARIKKQMSHRDSSAGGGESSGGGESAPSESASGSLPPIDAAPVPAPSPNEQTELLRQMRDSMAQQNRPKTIGEKAKGLIGQEAKKHADGFRDDAFANTGGVSSSKLDFKHMDD